LEIRNPALSIVDSTYSFFIQSHAEYLNILIDLENRFVLRLSLASIFRKLEFFALTKHVSDSLAICGW